jgi:hypothetical protein
VQKYYKDINMLGQLDDKQKILESVLNKSGKDTILYLKTSGAWTPSLSLENEDFTIINYYNFRVPDLKQTSKLFANLNPVWIHNVVNDAGGIRVSEEVSKIEIGKLEDFCTMLNNSRNPEREGKMLTSIGDWVFPDEWDRIEGEM